MFLLDVDLDLGGYDAEEELLEPLQKLLDQCKSAKVLSKCVFFWNVSRGCCLSIGVMIGN